jgi:hypothetical protein
MIRARLLIVGLTLTAAMIVAEASAQDCPDWLRWICSEESNARPRQAASRASEDSSRAPKQLRHKARQAKPAGAQPATNSRAPQIPAPAPSRYGKPTGHILNIQRSGDQRLAREEAPRGVRRGPMIDQEKEALFQQFLLWRKEQRPDADTVGEGSSQ